MSIPSRRTVAAVLLSLTLLAPLALTAACVTTQVGGIPTESEVSKREARTREDDQTGRLMVALDRKVGEFLFLDSEAGDDARAQRNETAGYLRAAVAQNLQPLLDFLERPDRARNRQIAAKSLGFSRDPRAVVALVRLLDPKSDARLLTAVTWSLGRIQSPTTPGGPLLELVLHPDRDVRNNALMALWHAMDARVRAGGSALDPIAHQRAISLFKTAMLDPDDSSVRGHAAACLGALRDPVGVDALLKQLEDDHPFVRTLTALALGKIGDVRALRPLVKIIDATDGSTPRSAVCAAIQLIAEQRGVAVPKQLASTSRAWGRFVEDRLDPLQ